MNKIKFFTSIICVVLALNSCGGSKLGGTVNLDSITPIKSEAFFKGADSYLNFTKEDLDTSFDLATKEIEKDPTSHKGYALRAQIVYMQSIIDFPPYNPLSKVFSSANLINFSGLSYLSKYVEQAKNDLSKAESIKPDSLEVYKAQALSKMSSPGYPSFSSEINLLADKILTIAPDDMIGNFIKYAMTPSNAETKENEYETKMQKLYPNFIPFKLLSGVDKNSYQTYLESDLLTSLEKIGLKDKLLGIVLSYKANSSSSISKYVNTLVEALKISPKNLQLRNKLLYIFLLSGNFNKVLPMSKEMCSDLKDEASCTLSKNIQDYSDSIAKITTPEEKKKTCLEDLTGKKEAGALTSTECSTYVSEYIDKKTKEFTAALPSPSPSSSSTPTQSSTTTSSSSVPSYNFPTTGTGVPAPYGDEEPF